MKNRILIFILSCLFSLSYSYAQKLQGKFYLDKNCSKNDTMCFQWESTLSPDNLKVIQWNFKDGTIVITESHYTYNNGSYYAPFDRIITRRKFYIYDEETGIIKIWNIKKSMKQSKEPSSIYRIYKYKPLLLVK